MADLQSKVPVRAKDTASTSKKPQPHRFRVSVPAADEAVLAWMELQDNQSLSVRLLIRESIERFGYVDVVNRPVTQLPTRPANAVMAPTRVQKPEPEQAEVKDCPPASADPEPEQTSGAPVEVNDIFSKLR